MSTTIIGADYKKCATCEFWTGWREGSLYKLLIPLTPITEQIALSDKYDKVKTVDFYHRYANPIIEQYDSLMNSCGTWQSIFLYYRIFLLINFSGQSANKESLRFRKMLIHSLECVQKNWKKGAAASFLFF